jgi:hypothetical protein
VSDHSEAFVAFDTSKLRNAVAIAEGGRSGEVRFLGEIESTAAATAKLVRKLSAKHRRLTFCYEAGPTGYGLYRLIKRLGHDCMVVAPSLIPKKAGDRGGARGHGTQPCSREAPGLRPPGTTTRLRGARWTGPDARFRSDDGGALSKSARSRRRGTRKRGPGT